MNTRVCLLDPEGEWPLHRIVLPFVGAETIWATICLGVAFCLDLRGENVLGALVCLSGGSTALLVLGGAVLVYALATRKLIWDV
jgi:hypothetical protein